MPKMRESPQQQFYNQLTKNIQIRMVYMDYSRKSLADRCCIKYSTLCKRLKEPDTWVLNELVAVMTVLKMDLGGLHEAN